MNIFQKLNKTKEGIQAEVRIKNARNEQVINSIKDIYYEEVNEKEMVIGLVTPGGDSITIKFQK